MISITHLLIFGAIILLLFGKTKLPALGKSIGEGARNFRKALRGEEDIDVTNSVKKLDDE